MRRGIEFVAMEPVRYLRLSLSRYRLLQVRPSAETTLLSTTRGRGLLGLFLPFMLYGRRARSGGATGCSTFILFYSVLHIFTWAMIRYRPPVDAVLLLFAALAIDELWRRIGHARACRALQTRFHRDPVAARIIWPRLGLDSRNPAHKTYVTSLFSLLPYLFLTPFVLFVMFTASFPHRCAITPMGRMNFSDIENSPRSAQNRPLWAALALTACRRPL